MKRKVNLATEIVQRAQRAYPAVLDGVVNYIGQPPYGKEVVGRQTSDNRLVRMLPDELQALAASDPKAYMDAQQRLETLRERAATREPLPGADAFEGER
jgi:hypothetical protein